MGRERWELIHQREGSVEISPERELMMICVWRLQLSWEHTPGDVSIEEPGNESSVEGNTLSLELVKQAPDALSVAMETVPHHQFIVSERSWFCSALLERVKLLQGL